MSTEENKNIDPHEDQLGENTGDSSLEKGNTPTEHTKDDEHRVDTVVPDNDSGVPGPPSDEESSNKNEGPANEDL
ncbi:hypothetical protein [uncultured Mucilaginibacter sp.]|uniref:hypothetical protein n=1 Tax=uncultured Mucilaginibacter sp. TaxID=797541 RepID=UPI0025DC6FC5|nr:hypothetical protein [uncultured Mucilaginibacter sp.]